MPVTLSIKNVPHRIAQQLRRRAARNHRSLQGELMAILEEASQQSITVEQLVEGAKALGLHTPDESVKMIREDRDGRRR